LFCLGIDDADSECDLDSSEFDVNISNDGDDVLLDQQISNLVSDINNKQSTVQHINVSNITVDQ